MSIRSGVCIALFAAAGAVAPWAQAEWNADGHARGNSVPEYGSDHRVETRALPPAAGNTPEDDARPGEYYFRLGVAAFRHKDYAHAVNMYEVAASWAYKPAQFNLGVMYARGQGVATDLPRALAWMALAAERDEQEFVDAKELIYGFLSEREFAQANAIWRELRKTYGDAAALPRAKRRWAEVRNGATGSHVGANAGPLLVGNVAAQGKATPASGASGDVASNVIAGGYRSDGSIAYKQLRDSSDPYDPKFARTPTGSAAVGAPQPADDGRTDEPGKG